MTDLCQQNNQAVFRSANLPDEVKSEKVQRQEQHLSVVQKERSLYNSIVQDAKKTVKEKNIVDLSPSSDLANNRMHYSFDYAQQVHYPSDPLQPGPVYFLVPRKCGIFGICCEGIPQQVNYLINEGMCSSKGSNSVISYLHHFFANYGLGESAVDLHCDNCSGQNKNRFVLWYLAWRVLVGLHKEISINFMIAGHTKFSPDWCFGLLKQSYRRTPVSSLGDISEAVKHSTVTGVNVPQLVGTEDGTVIVPTYDWQSFLEPYFRPLPGMKKLQHFRFNSDNPGVVHYQNAPDEPEQSFQILQTPNSF